MAADADFLADRRLLRRQLSFWRVLAILVLIGAVAGGGWLAAGPRGGLGRSPQIARIAVSGFIAGDQRMTDLFRRVGDDPAVRGVVLAINSPGGTTSGSEELFRGIRTLAAKKPTVAFVDGLAASGAYIAALGADRIVARETALVGSIGVLFQYPDFSKLLGTVGVAIEEVKSSPLKAEPSGFHPPPPEAVAALRAVVADTYAWFRGLVETRRGLTGPALDAVADGRIFSARQGMPLKLVDELGTERDAIAWMERDKAVPRDLPVAEWKPRGTSGFSLWSAAGFAADLLGWERAAVALRGGLGSDARVDGLLVLWQPRPAER